MLVSNHVAQCHAASMLVSVFAGALLFGLSTAALPADVMKFWNLTGTTITKLYFAAVGTTQWGPDQCANDKDGTVESDERLKLTGVAAGHYAVKLVDTAGRTCVLKDVTLSAGKSYAFSLSQDDLKACLNNMPSKS